MATYDSWSSKVSTCAGFHTQEEPSQADCGARSKVVIERASCRVATSAEVLRSIMWYRSIAAAKRRLKTWHGCADGTIPKKLTMDGPWLAHPGTGSGRLPLQAIVVRDRRLCA